MVERSLRKNFVRGDETYWQNAVVETNHLSKSVRSPENWSYDKRWRHILYYATLQSTLQPIETVSAIRLNLRRSNCDDCLNRPRQMRYPDRVRPPQRGEDERRIGQEKKCLLKLKSQIMLINKWSFRVIFHFSHYLKLRNKILSRVVMAQMARQKTHNWKIGFNPQLRQEKYFILFSVGCS